jgi:hypothetical protein
MQKWSENYKTSHHIIVWIHKNPKKVSNDFEQLIVHISHLGPSISISRFIRSDGCWLFETLVASSPHLIPIPPWIPPASSPSKPPPPHQRSSQDLAPVVARPLTSRLQPPLPFPPMRTQCQILFSSPVGSRSPRASDAPPSPKYAARLVGN